MAVRSVDAVLRSFLRPAILFIRHLVVSLRSPNQARRIGRELRFPFYGDFPVLRWRSLRGRASGRTRRMPSQPAESRQDTWPVCNPTRAREGAARPRAVFRPCGVPHPQPRDDLQLTACPGRSRPLLDLLHEPQEPRLEHFQVAPEHARDCLLYTSPSPRDGLLSRMPSSA